MYNVLKTTLALQSTFYIAIQFSRLRPISHNLILLPVFQAVKEHHKRCNRWHLQVRASQYQLHKDNPIYSLSDALREVGSALLLLKWRNYERRTVQDKSGPGRSKELWHQTQLSGALICIERGLSVITYDAGRRSNMKEHIKQSFTHEKVEHHFLSCSTVALVQTVGGTSQPWDTMSRYL